MRIRDGSFFSLFLENSESSPIFKRFILYEQ